MLASFRLVKKISKLALMTKLVKAKTFLLIHIIIIHKVDNKNMPFDVD